MSERETRMAILAAESFDEMPDDKLSVSPTSSLRHKLIAFFDSLLLAFGAAFISTQVASDEAGMNVYHPWTMS